MRILTVTNLYPNPYQPHRATFNRQQVRHLAERHEVRVIAPILWTDERAARREVGALLPSDRRMFCDGVPVEHPRYWYTPKMLRDLYGPFFKWSIREAFERAVAEFRPDVVFAPWAYPDGWAAVELGHSAGVPVVVKLHGSDILSLDAFPKRLGRTVDALRRADAIYAVSRDLADRVAAMGVDPGRIRVIYDGVDTGQFHPGPKAEARALLGLDPDRPMLLFIGNLLPVKGVDQLVEACGRLAGSGLDFTGHLIGQGPLRDQVAWQINRLGLEDRVKLLGSRPHEQIPDWFRAADLFVLPSHSEGVPVVLLEAAACGTPFVASRVGGIPEITHLVPSRLVPPLDVPALSEAIHDGLAGRFHPPVGGPASLRGHAEAVAEIVDLFEDVLRGRREPAAAR